MHCTRCIMRWGDAAGSERLSAAARMRAPGMSKLLPADRIRPAPTFASASEAIVQSFVHCIYISIYLKIKIINARIT